MGGARGGRVWVSAPSSFPRVALLLPVQIKLFGSCLLFLLFPAPAPRLVRRCLASRGRGCQIRSVLLLSSARAKQNKRPGDGNWQAVRGELAPVALRSLGPGAGGAWREQQGSRLKRRALAAVGFGLASRRFPSPGRAPPRQTPLPLNPACGRPWRRLTSRDGYPAETCHWLGAAQRWLSEGSTPTHPETTERSPLTHPCALGPIDFEFH